MDIPNPHPPSSSSPTISLKRTLKHYFDISRLNDLALR